MLSYNEIKIGTILELDGEPFSVQWTSGIIKKQRQKPHLNAKLRNLRTYSTIEKTFTQSDKIKEAEIDTKKMRFVYSGKGKVVFSEPEDPGKRISLSEEIVGEKLNYINEKDLIDMILFEDEIIDIKLPIKVDLRVIDAPPNIRGNTISGGNKMVTLETGLKVKVPLFIESGDTVKVNTQTGEYVSRA